MPAPVSSVISRISNQLPSRGTFIRSPIPSGSSTNTNGTRNAGIVYFHDCSVVL